jgi:hypothetical protein
VKHAGWERADRGQPERSGLLPSAQIPSMSKTGECSSLRRVGLGTRSRGRARREQPSRGCAQRERARAQGRVLYVQVVRQRTHRECGAARGVFMRSPERPVLPGLAIESGVPGRPLPPYPAER